MPPLCFTGHVEALDTTRRYLLGLIHVHLDEPDAALAEAVDVDATTVAPAPLRTLAGDSARGIRALLANRRGDDARALAMLEDCAMTVPMHLHTSHPPPSMAAFTSATSGRSSWARSGRLEPGATLRGMLHARRVHRRADGRPPSPPRVHWKRSR
jgi:hypothetical protein